MFSKLMKWLSSDRTEAPRELEPEVSAAVAGPMCARARERFGVTIGDDVMRDVLLDLRRRRKIEAVKRIREATGLGLKESKDIADDLYGALKRV